MSFGEGDKFILPKKKESWGRIYLKKKLFLTNQTDGPVLMGRKVFFWISWLMPDGLRASISLPGKNYSVQKEFRGLG